MFNMAQSFRFIESQSWTMFNARLCSTENVRCQTAFYFWLIWNGTETFLPFSNLNRSTKNKMAEFFEEKNENFASILMLVN